MDTYTTSQAREDLHNLINIASESHLPIYIVGEHPKVVLISEEYYKGMQETLYLFSIPGMRESILEAREIPLEEYTDILDWGDDD